MVKDPFEQLEERIGQAVTRIRVLSEERARLQGREEELEQKLAELADRNRRLEEEIVELRDSEGAREDFESTRREIERRVESLLERFTELDELAAD
jgi:predicted  nucleic acid-binding Zn-ribbon protein